MEDIEDLFNEAALQEESPMIIPEFGPCSVDGGADEETKESSKAGSTACC